MHQTRDNDVAAATKSPILRSNLRYRADTSKNSPPIAWIIAPRYLDQLGSLPHNWIHSHRNWIPRFGHVTQILEL